MSARKSLNLSSANKSSFVYIKPHPLGQDTSRTVKKKHHERMLDQVKKLELMIKEQRRINERLRDGVAEKRSAC